MSTDPAQHQPSYVLVYGDGPEREASKLVWSILGGSDVKIEIVNDIQEFDTKISNSALTFIVIGEDDRNAEICASLLKRTDLIGDIFGLAYDAETDRRVRLMAAGFDAIFNRHMIQNLDFKEIVSKKVEKARLRHTSRVMQEEYRRFRAALAASPDALIVFDNQKRLFFVSEHYRRAYPALEDRLVPGVTVLEAFEMARQVEGVSEDDPRYPLLKNFWESLSGQIEFQSNAGRYSGRVWRMKASPLGDGQGTIVTTIDITHIENRKREIEEKSTRLAEALTKEQEASALQKQFIGMISHEFRTPLAIIDGHAQLILRRDDMDMDSVRTRCKTIRGAVSRLVQMMDSILSSSLLETGRMEVFPEFFDLGTLIQDLCEEQIELANGHQITWDVESLGGPVCLDQRMMTLVLTNLLANAVKFSRDDPRIHVTARTGDDNTIVITVKDNGIGIPAGEIGRIFERYYRATTSSGIPGTGIGLNLVQELVQLHHGRVTVDSTVGEGTCFTLILRNLGQAL